MSFALDTNTLIYFFKGLGNVADRMLATPPGEVRIPAIVVYELETGIAKSSAPARRHRQLHELLNTVDVLPFDRGAASRAAEIRVHLEGCGTPIGPMDTLIAATALANQATLVTHNTREFERVPALQVVDWFNEG
ncbi:type II toxin-antitoxin system VapC family toxin [Methylonatrum kenyense]|uniref:type II toxin-antitoxin system VapC family toxin n=1 Tax=Methylonatrum kenyense TaxID=455253 RepID=UPI0020BF3F7C|nr:type II toxin-antitoxin system VapC family toxin [Methylonatrum kenyense]MCK8516981.1 type II toxin-antitoxin system VapC family toxin [Methylonatrum kenyense]